MRARAILGRNIRRYRLQADMSQGRLAQLIGASTPRISNLERGVYACSIDGIERLAAALDVPLHALLEDTGSLELPEEQAPRPSKKPPAPAKTARVAKTANKPRSKS
jgi:transcriptional regulator with XRE-family HTH domain